MFLVVLGSNHRLAQAGAVVVVVVFAERSPPLRSRGDVAYSGSCASVWLSEAASTNLNQSCWRAWLADGRSRGSGASRDRNSRCAASLKRACSSPAKASARQFICGPSSPSLRTYTAHGGTCVELQQTSTPVLVPEGCGSKNAPCVDPSASRRCDGQGRTRAPCIVAAAVDLVASSCERERGNGNGEGSRTSLLRRMPALHMSPAGEFLCSGGM